MSLPFQPQGLQPNMAPVPQRLGPTPGPAPQQISPGSQPQTMAPYMGMPTPPPAPNMAMMPGPVTSMMDSVRQSIATARVSSQRRDVPEGQAIYVVNNMEFRVTQGQDHIDVCHLTCLLPIQDGNGVRYGESGYTGAIPGSSYEYSIFRNYKWNTHSQRWLDIVVCFQEITPDVLKQWQASVEGQNHIVQLIQCYIGFDFTTGQPIQSVLANTHCAEINCQVVRKPKKINRQPVMDATTGQPIMQDLRNVYFNRNVKVAEVWQALGGSNAELVYRCFGGKENFERAYQLQNS